MTSLDELPKHESKRYRPDDRRENHHGRESRKQIKKQIRGLLKKGLGKPWNQVWSDIKHKVKPLNGDKHEWLIKWDVVLKTWVDNGQLMHDERLSGKAEPLTTTTYYVDPNGILQHQTEADNHRYHYRRPMNRLCMPSTPDGKGLEYICVNGIWYTVEWTPEENHKRRDANGGADVKIGHLTSQLANSKQKNLERQIEKELTEVRYDKVKSFHRGYPATWYRKSLNRAWSRIIEANRNKSIHGILRALENETVQLSVKELAAHWFPVPGEPEVGWTPYIWVNHRLVKNPNPDIVCNLIKIRPQVRKANRGELGIIQAIITHN